MTDEKLAEFIGAHKEILASLRDITKDHEKRLRIVEKVVFGIMAIVASIKTLQALHWV